MLIGRGLLFGTLIVICFLTTLFNEHLPPRQINFDLAEPFVIIHLVQYLVLFQILHLSYIPPLQLQPTIHETTVPTNHCSFVLPLHLRPRPQEGVKGERA